MINRYTVIGRPVAHSLSPAIHHMFGEHTQRRIEYTRTEADPDTFIDTVKHWREVGGKGCNITSPFKEQAAAVCDRLHRRAELAQAVNTLHMHPDGSIVGYNTDGIGLLADLKRNKHCSIEGARILVLGAGGAVRGILEPFLEQRPSELVITNRTVDKAKKLADDFSLLGNVSAGNYDELSDKGAFDLIINATSMGFGGDSPPVPVSAFAPSALAYDMMYQSETPFLNWCHNNGIANTSNGFGMLVEQAAEAFLVWEGVRPKTRMLYPRTSEIINSV